VADSPEVAGRQAPLVGEGTVRRFGATARTYFQLTKPRVIELLLVTTLPSMILAAGKVPPLDLIAAVLAGGALSAAGANTVNCWIERDRDQLMQRTRRRPLPTGQVSPQGALAFGLVLEAAAFVLLWTTVNLLAAALAVGAMLFYVFVYTIWLKPRTPQNIVIGGAAGAVPVLVGWAAVTGSIATPAWVMFAIVFFWTPPHFWALSLRYYDDYENAGFPMLPITKGIPRAVHEIAAYSVVVVATTLLLPAVSEVGVIYTVTAAVLGVAFVAVAVRLTRRPTAERAIAMFTFSNTYLALLFAAIAVDTIVRSL
jgi:heme o synthase